VVVDLQAGVLAMDTAPYAATEVLARNVELADAFRAHGLPVVLVRVSFAPDGADAPPGRTDAGRPGGARPEGWDVLVDDITGSDGSGDIVVTKHNWGAFHGTDLDVQLRRRGVTQVVVTGIATSMGVESTARAAHEHGYHVTLPVDAMADGDVERHHNSVQRVFPRLAETGTTVEVLRLLARRLESGAS
jgi:nicotinamidase-related amidase